MEWMDRYRRFGGWVWLVAGLVLQAVGLAAGWAQPGPVTWVLIADVTAFGAVVLIRPSDRPARILARATAVLFALDLTGAVLDRFGVLGGPGQRGVSWGDWARFEDYTAVLLHHPGAAVVTAAAVGATAVEIGLAVALASGRQSRWVGKAAAGLFAVYLLAMTASPARADVVRYAVPILVGGALLLSATETKKPTALRPPPAGSRRSARADRLRIS